MNTMNLIWNLMTKANIYHGDIHGNNFMFHDKKLYLIDFGFVRLATQKDLRFENILKIVQKFMCKFTECGFHFQAINVGTR